MGRLKGGPAPSTPFAYRQLFMTPIPPPRTRHSRRARASIHILAGYTPCLPPHRYFCTFSLAQTYRPKVPMSILLIEFLEYVRHRPRDEGCDRADRERACTASPGGECRGRDGGQRTEWWIGIDDRGDRSSPHRDCYFTRCRTDPIRSEAMLGGLRHDSESAGAWPVRGTGSAMPINLAREVVGVPCGHISSNPRCPRRLDRIDART